MTRTTIPATAQTTTDGEDPDLTRPEPSIARTRRATISAFVLSAMLMASCAVDTTAAPDADPEVGSTTAEATTPTATAAPTDIAVDDDHESSDGVADGGQDSNAANPGSEEGHGEELKVIGAIIGVDGDLTATTLITIVTAAGDEMTFRPGSGATFHGGAISHVRDHLVSGAKVLVEYHELSDGSLEATHIEDAEDGH